jgi:DNA-binding transcriptional ArsR family regulator
MENNLSKTLPTELRAFLYSCLDSWEQVELLVAILASGRVWTSRAVGAEFGLPEAAARHHLETLTARGLLTARAAREIEYRFEPRTPDLARYCELLKHHHETERTAVLNFMTTGLRRSARRFSDAFKLKDRE